MKDSFTEAADLHAFYNQILSRRRHIMWHISWSQKITEKERSVRYQISDFNTRP